MSRTHSAHDEPFAELVRTEAFGDATSGEAAELRQPENIERWLNELTRVAQSVQQQLRDHNLGHVPRNDGWAGSATHVFKRYCKRIEEVKLLVQRERLRWNAFDAPALSGEVGRLRKAIRDHAAASRLSGIEPESWDVRLWDHVTGAAR